MDAATDQPNRRVYRGATGWGLRSGARDVAIALGASVSAGFAIQARISLAVVLVVASLVGAIVAYPLLGAVALGASLPFARDLAAGHLGVRVAASDIVLTFLALRVLGDAVVSRETAALRALRPVRLAVVPYTVLLALLVVLHTETGAIVNTAQRFELFLGPLLIGAYLALRRDHMHALRAYVVAASVLAFAWPLNLFELQKDMQKNPTGQFFANGILLLVGVPGLRRYLVCLPLLVFGLFGTESRGSILALLIGIAVLIAIGRGHNLRLVLARVVPLLLIALVAFHWLPSGARARVTSFKASSATAAGYSIYVRDRYQQDAKRIISLHPWTGVGVGRYVAGDRSAGTLTTDPHQVVLLEAAGGGYPLAAAFLLLMVGTALALVRLRRIELAPAALGVVIATVAHGMVDVYWVRGTPVLSWLLVGLVCGLAFDRRTDEAPQ